ncbi:MAG: sugar phosphate isomerase/epimerase [Clostridiales bacterium]|nr:sugar phosphate isomerase/epimerase [Clostridiales bacterium]
MAKINKLGVQLYTIRDFMGNEESVKESFAKLKALGIDEVQTAGCAIAYDKFGALAKEAGLTVVGTHDDFDAMHKDPVGYMKLHDDLGTKMMGNGGYWGEKAEDYLAFASKVNELCSVIGEKGFKFSYHNHGHEFTKFDGKIAMDILAENMDPRYATFCLDTYWVQYGGGDVRAWIKKLAGRIEILHLKDMGFKGGQFITEIGNGNLYWDGIIDAANEAGVKHFVIEQDSCPGNPFDSLAKSVEYLKKYL